MQANAETAPSNIAIWAGRIMSGVVVLFFVFDATIKFMSLEIVATTSEQLGIPVNLAPMLGVIALICTALYVYPRTAVLGAILLTGYLGGAVWTHLRVGSPLFTHLFFGVYLGLLIWGGLYLRDGRVRALIPLRAA